MDDQENQQHTPVWPPPIISDLVTSAPQTKMPHPIPINLGGVILGFFCGSILYFLFEISLFVIYVKIGVAQMTGSTSQERLETFYAAKVVEALSLGIPVIVYLWFRKYKQSFVLGLLIGGCLVMLLFVRLFFIGI